MEEQKSVSSLMFHSIILLLWLIIFYIENMEMWYVRTERSRREVTTQAQ